MRSYFSSRRRVVEPEKPEPRFHWRTRVNSLMNEDEDKSSLPKRQNETSPLPIYPNNDNNIDKNGGAKSKRQAILHSNESPYNDEFRATRGRLKFDKQTNDHSVEERRRERFIRTNSDSRLKMRVRFSKEEYLETSRSLDAADEKNDLPRSRFLRRSRSKEKSMTGSFDRSEGDISEDNDEFEDEFIGACGCSFDSGLDLRDSSSPEEDDEAFMEESIGREVRNDGKEFAKNSESMESASRVDQMRHEPAAMPANISYQGGAIPKKPHNLLSGTQRMYETKTTFPNKIMFEEAVEDKDRHKPFDSFHKNSDRPDKIMFEKDVEDRERNKPFDSFLKNSDRLPDCQKDYFRDLSPDMQCRIETSDQTFDEDHPRKESTPPHQRPGFSFFNDQIDGIEEIIQKIISEEEENNSDESRRSIKQAASSLIEDEELRNEVENWQQNIDECNYQSTNVFGVHRRDIDQSTESNFEHAMTSPSQDNTTENDEDASEKSEEGEEDTWALVPKILLEDIFTLLTPKDRHQSSQVCKQWYDLFYSPRVWETFILLERTLTKKRFNLYKGYQRELCPWKTQLCLRRVGSFFKRIIITPITDYFNLFEFLRVLAAFLQYQEEHGQSAMPLLHTFDFTFACATRGEDGVMVHGTGGQILDMIVKLLIQMSQLKHLKLNQLLTDVEEIPDLFNALTTGFGDSLNSLEMLNVTKMPFGLTELSQFRNLIKLTVSPQHLNEEVLILLAGLNLLHLHLIQDVYTCQCEPVPWEAWKLLKEMAPWMRVYLEISGITRTQLLIQPRAPVHGIFLRTPFSQLNNDLLTELVEQYSKTLRYLVQERLPRVHGPRNFDTRCDSSLLFLIRRCPHLHTLVVSERMSTATLILIGNEGKNLNTLLVRQNALIKRCDWPGRGEWSREFYRHLKSCALDYDKCTAEICTLLRHRWRPLTDKQFMRLKIVPKVDIF